MTATARARRAQAGASRACSCLGAALLAVFSLCASPAWADPRANLARTTCSALDQAVTEQPGGPLLLVSYQTAQGKPPGVDAASDIDALRDVAFTYDNALASIALFACGKPTSARRIADALVLATSHDPEFRDGRVRNAYAAGPVKDTAMTLPGYWSSERQSWNQDAYMVSSATGNAAWAALALLEAFRQTRHASYLDAARGVLEWIRRSTLDMRAPAGFVGGFFAADGHPVRQEWKSTEQNTDLAAAWTALDRLVPDVETRARATIAVGFVRSQWDGTEGRFYIGTGPDGQTSDRDHSGLDAQIWPLVALPNPPTDWMRVLAFVEATHGVDGGYGFKRRPDGLWTEGTAQMASVFVLRGLARKAAPLWPLLERQRGDRGWLFATPKARIATGLAVGPASVTDDFFYHHLPHLGATAWAAIAALGVNPFIGR